VSRLSIPRPRRGASRRLRAAQGALLSLLAPAGWLCIQAVRGHLPHALETPDLGLYAYMLFGSMAAFAAFGWLLGREQERLERLAMLDELTGLANNRLFKRCMDECASSSARTGKPLSLMLVDLDHFKNINDTYGHQAGDLALKTAAMVLRRCVRNCDVAARVGGEEFAVILPHTATLEAAKAASRLLERLRATRVSLPDGRSIGLSASIGLAGGLSGQDESPTELFALADKALYQAKAEGRDRLVVA